MNDVTPTQELILEVLVARHRLGESLWTFGSRSRKQADELASLGLISVMDGCVEHTYRARLTDKGRQLHMSETYKTPQEVRVADLERERETLWRRVIELQERVA